MDIKALGFPFRILEMRDGEDLTINESEPSEPSKPQKLVRIRGYFSCGWVFTFFDIAGR